MTAKKKPKAQKAPKKPAAKPRAATKAPKRRAPAKPAPVTPDADPRTVGHQAPKDAKPAKKPAKAPTQDTAPPEDKPRRGRPSTYSKQIGDEIVELLSEGIPLAEICRRDGMPGLRTVYDWEEAHPEFSARIARARVAGYDMIAVEALRIADTQEEGERRKQGKDGIEITTEDMLGHRKLRVETRLKLLAKWDPKRYGDKIEHSGTVHLASALDAIPD